MKSEQDKEGEEYIIIAPCDLPVRYYAFMTFRKCISLKCSFRFPANDKETQLRTVWKLECYTQDSSRLSTCCRFLTITDNRHLRSKHVRSLSGALVTDSCHVTTDALYTVMSLLLFFHLLIISLKQERKKNSWVSKQQKTSEGNFFGGEGGAFSPFLAGRPQKNFNQQNFIRNSIKQFQNEGATYPHLGERPP